jgi:hypothetical protein
MDERMKTMKHSLAGMIAAGCLGSSAGATFVTFIVTSTTATTAGQSLVIYKVYAQFNGGTDTVLNCFNLVGLNGPTLNDFWHKDNASYNTGVLQREFGTWNPSQTGSITLNRPFDSYLTVGGVASGTNTTNADPSWTTGGNADARSWNRADLPNNGTLGWFNSNPPNLAGRVGLNGNSSTDVMVGQFVLSQGHCAKSFSLTLGYNNGVPGAPVQFGTASFELGSSGTPATWYRDIDGDGIGFAADGTLTSCQQPAGYVGVGGDNCPDIANPNQADVNSNTVGDACELARGDLNLDGIVNASDVPLFLNLWGSTGASGGDFNFDGAVNALDFSILLANWGTTP